MNATASFLSETSLSRRGSTETVFSIQERETDYVQDSSDSQWHSEEDIEYEPVTASEEEELISGATSGQSDEELISRKVVTVSGDEGDEGDLQLADSEGHESASEGERAPPHYWSCARCHNSTEDNRVRYCDKCFKLRKNFFPPRPRGRRGKQDAASQESLPSTSSQDSGINSLYNRDLPKLQDTPVETIPQTMSQDSGIDSMHSQEIVSSQDIFSQGSSHSSQELIQDTHTDARDGASESRLGKLKRRSESADRAYKRARLDSDTERDSRVEVAPLVKTVSDPAVTIESLDSGKDGSNMCIICLSEPKSGVFVHRRVAHICCCYNCAVKVWSKARRCPICNCKVSNVLKAVVM